MWEAGARRKRARRMVGRSPPASPMLRLVSERIIARRAGLGEPAGALCGHVDRVLEADAELAVDADGRLVGEAHPDLDRGLVAADHVALLVHVHADAMARPVRQAGG